MKITIIVACIALALGIVLIPNAFAENVPDWVKNTAGWWATDVISETEFVNAIEFLVNEEIIQVSDTTSGKNGSESIPDWIKNNAGWWANDQIDDKTFVNGIEFLIKEGIITLEIECKFFSEEYAESDPSGSNIGFNYDKEFKQKLLCKFSNFDFIKFWYNPYEVKDNEINSFGFRGAEFSEEKSIGSYRIFMVGGSTVFGDGVEVHNTIPSLLQNFYSNDKFDNIKQIEVINAGIQGARTSEETNLIKNKLSKMSPDLIIVYDGWNNSKIGNFGNFEFGQIENEVAWKNRWTDICNLYSTEFDIVVVLQPILSHEKIVLTDQEYTNYYARGLLQNEIQNLNKFGMYVNELNSTCSSAHDLRNIMKDVSTGIFYDQGHMTPTGNKIIAKKIYEITLPIIEKSSQLIASMNDKKIESESKNHQPELNSKVDYRGKIIVRSDFSEKNIPNTIAYFSTFIETDFSSSDLRNMDSKFSKFFRADFSNAQLQNSSISRSVFEGSDFNNADLSQSYLSTSMFFNSDLTNSVFENSNLRGAKMVTLVLENTNFKNVDFSHAYLINLDFTKTALQNSKFIGAHIKKCTFDGMDFSTFEIHGKHIVDAGSPTSFVSCSMKHSNFSKANLFNVDFTPREFYEEGENVTYSGSDLSHSLFADSDLRVTKFSHNSEVDHETFFNQKYSIPVDTDALELVRNFVSVKLEYSKFDNVNLRDNDLSVMSLRHSQITDSDLTNVYFKNSDLSFSSIVNSDLSGANLEGANLEGATLDNAILTGANLKCINHPICEGN